MRLPSWFTRLPRHPMVRATRVALVHRVAVAWGTARRAWRRSLQLRMVTITLVVSGALVGGFGTLVATQIITGMVNTKVKSAVQQAGDAAIRAAQQFGGVTDAADTRLVNVHVQRLRAKIEKDPEHPEIVVTVRGVGYKAGTG